MTTAERTTSTPLSVRQARARAVLTASKGRDVVVPRVFYELAGQPVPDNATNELQRGVFPRYK